MRILVRYTLKRVFSTAVATFLIFCFLVMAVETFMHLDSYISSENTDFVMMVRYAFSSLSNYYLLLLSVSFLFSVSYFLSNMSANNELISIYGAGISRRRLIAPIFISACILTVFFFAFNETLGLEWKDYNIRLSAEYFGQSGTSDPRNISLYDESTGYLVHAAGYNKDSMRLYSPVIVKCSDGSIEKRIEARYADYDKFKWVIYDARVIQKGDEGFSTVFHDSYEETDFLMEPSLFESQNMRMETMDASSAYDYLKKLEKVNPTAYQEKMTDFLSRFFEPLSILIMIVIALMMNYTFKKNILLFSIVQSLIIAVVYYVSDMVFSIISRQGMVPAYSVAVFPFLLTVLLSLVISKIGKRI